MLCDPQPSELARDDIPLLRARWIEEIREITGSIPLRPPPLPEINHCIPLIDPRKPHGDAIENRTPFSHKQTE
jgi:hypothetical protein